MPTRYTLESQASRLPLRVGSSLNQTPHLMVGTGEPNPWGEGDLGTEGEGRETRCAARTPGLRRHSKR
jgi:hypothetical protein